MQNYHNQYVDGQIIWTTNRAVLDFIDDFKHDLMTLGLSFIFIYISAIATISKKNNN